MNTVHAIFVLLVAYVLGSLPFGLWVGFAKGVDIRKLGSGNVGATNIVRNLGWGPGLVVFAADIAKGVIPVLIAKAVEPDAWQGGVTALCGALAMAGHIFSPFLRFRGGRGVATALGVLLGLDWRVGIGGFGAWLAVVLIVRIVSVASIIAAASVPVLMWLFKDPRAYLWFGCPAAAIVIVRHWPNIKRLARGTEPRWGKREDERET
jgi:glycerol-3-phosphate acyltransferase PlsY